MSLVDWLLLGMVGIMGILSESSNSVVLLLGSESLCIQGAFRLCPGFVGLVR